MFQKELCMLQRMLCMYECLAFVKHNDVQERLFLQGTRLFSPHTGIFLLDYRYMYIYIYTCIYIYVYMYIYTSICIRIPCICQTWQCAEEAPLTTYRALFTRYFKRYTALFIAYRAFYTNIFTYIHMDRCMYIHIPCICQTQ